VRKLFPDRKWVSFRLEEGIFTGSNMLVFNAGAISRIRPLAERVITLRRQTLKALWTAGPLFLLFFLLGRARLAYVESKATTITGCRCRGIPLPLPELAMDVDRPEDVEWAENYLRHSRGEPSIAAAARETN
jgi:hypothetical protein